MRIVCLPVAGEQNPYQSLMINGLNKSESIDAFNGADDRFFGVFKTAIKYQPNYIHFDWINSYYVRKKTWLTLLLLPLFYFQVLFVRYCTKTKLVWTLHNIVPHDVKHIRLHKMVRSFFAKQCEWIRLFSETSVSRASQELNIPAKKCIVIPEGDYVSVYPNTVSRKEARSKLNIELDKTILLSIGYLKPYKGLENLIVEFSKIKDPRVELIIAGQSIDKKYTRRLREQMEELQDKRIQLIDTFIDIPTLQVYYNAANAVVLPFDKVENSGSVIMAMGFKKAILAPKIGVLEKRLKNQTELLYTSLAKGLNDLFLLDTAALNQFGNQNFLALQQYDWVDFANAFKSEQN